MTDLYVQARILYYLYENHIGGEQGMLLQSLHATDYLQTQISVDHAILIKELEFLNEKGYVKSGQQQKQLWKISATGIEKIEGLFKNFLEYIKEHNIKDWDYYANHFKAINSTNERINKMFFKIHNETVLLDAFKEYLKSSILTA
jgi:hypothetical protein